VPLYGYVTAHEAFMMTNPTRKTRVSHLLAYGDELTILGYTDDGEAIDGNSRWYRTLSGYVHGSFVRIKNDNADS
jgi:hypothetical protein